MACQVSGSKPGDSWVYVHQDQDYMVAVSAGSVQLWSSGIHRVCLSVQHNADLAVNGANIAAYWCSARRALAVLVGGAGGLVD
jgi:hypothetical protein